MKSENVREILGKLIGYLEDWEIEKTDISRKINVFEKLYFFYCHVRDSDL